MTSRTAQFVRAYESVAADTPLADRWDDLIAQSEALEQRMTDARDEHRADCLARYGYDIFAGDE